MKYEKGSFTTIPNIQLLHGKNPILQTIFMWICKFSNEDGICFPSQKTLSECCGIGIDSCRVYLKQLEKMGILKRERRIENNVEITSVYAVIVPPLPDPVPSPAKSTTPPLPNRDGTKSILTKSTKLNTKKIQVRDYVEMTEEELERLKNDYGIYMAKEFIDRLDNYIGSKGVKYKDHNRTIRNWINSAITKRYYENKLEEIGISRFMEYFGNELTLKYVNT